MTEILDPFVAVFNGHVNDAQERADEAFVKRFGELAFEYEIRPHHKNGIMSIFQVKPNEYTVWYVEMIAVFANEFNNGSPEYFFKLDGVYSKNEKSNLAKENKFSADNN